MVVYALVSAAVLIFSVVNTEPVPDGGPAEPTCWILHVLTLTVVTQCRPRVLAFTPVESQGRVGFHRMTEVHLCSQWESLQGGMDEIFSDLTLLMIFHARHTN